MTGISITTIIDGEEQEVTIMICGTCAAMVPNNLGDLHNQYHLVRDE
jgi:hypothetical protein